MTPICVAAMCPNDQRCCRHRHGGARVESADQPQFDPSRVEDWQPDFCPHFRPSVTHRAAIRQLRDGLA
jgi:hypothetical protein